MKNPGWWTDDIFTVLGLSAFLLICKGGFFYIYLVWGLYLAKGWKIVKSYPSEANKNEFAGQAILGGVVCIVTTVISIMAMIRY